jgi:hypothetical protein
MQPMGRLSMHSKCLVFFPSKFLFLLGEGMEKKYWATCKVIVQCPHGEWTITFYMHR